MSYYVIKFTTLKGRLHHYIEIKERNVLFKDALNTFSLRLYGVRHMVKDHSDSERGNHLSPLSGLFFPISSKGYFICTIPQTLTLLHKSRWTGWNEKYLNGSTISERFDEPSHHNRILYHGATSLYRNHHHS